jgi:hypothetical protein
MRKPPLLVLLAGLAIAVALWLPSSRPLRADSKPQAPPLKLKVGDMAPNFTLVAFDGQELKKYSLRDFRGKKNVALAFYVFAFTGG